MATKTTKSTKTTKATTQPVKMPVKKVAAKVPTAKKTVSKPVAEVADVKAVKSTGGKLVASVVGVDGASVGTMNLSEEVFGVKVNKQLLAQAVRVYLANQREGTAHTKTRGNVEGSTRKIYKQKGTGRARHGSIRAPIFVGGGVVFGPQSHDYSLRMPDKMKRVALASALTQQYQDGNVIFMDGLQTLEAKTKLVANALTKAGTSGRVLFVVAADAPTVARAARNIKGITVVPTAVLNTYDVITHKKVVFMKTAVPTKRG